MEFSVSSVGEAAAAPRHCASRDQVLGLQDAVSCNLAVKVSFCEFIRGSTEVGTPCLQVKTYGSPQLRIVHQCDGSGYRVSIRSIDR
jgi:hypothetical protein